MSDDRPLVLVVEDEAALRDVAAGLLALSGYRVATAEHGTAALAWLAAGHWPDVLLLDIWLPSMTGIELLERWRLQYGRVPPVIVATAYSLTGETERLTAAVAALVAPSAVRVLTKPYDVAALEAAVAAVLTEGAGA